MAPIIEEAACSYLADELWNCIFKSLKQCDLEQLSTVSKQFLSITSSLRFSITITDQAIPILPRLFQRFPNLTSLRITISEPKNALLTEISTFPLPDIKSLYLSNLNTEIPIDGLRALSKKMKNLTSLTCSRILGIKKNHLFAVADCFSLLEELNLNFPIISSKCDLVIRNDHQVLSLPQLRKINLSGDRMDRQFLNDVWKISEPFEDDIITYTDDIETVPVLVTFNY
jgi:F-box/leucine-rich repeat protein 2/20